MKIVEAPLKPVNQSSRLERLTLEAEMAQGRLMIAQIAARMRENAKKLKTLKAKGELHVEKPTYTT
jgi:hypothetical protein